MEEADSESSTNQEQLFSAEERQTTLKKNGLMLSRKHILQQLQSSSNDRYSELLRRTLAGLDAQIAALR